MNKTIPMIELTDPLDAALDDLQSSGVPAVAVTDHKGTFLGYVTRENIGEWAVLSSTTRRN